MYNSGMMTYKALIASIFVGCVSITGSAAIDLEKDVWFLADFDSPAQINGRILGQEQDPHGYVEGRFGRGYWFFPPINNRLPRTDLFLSEPGAFVGEGLEIKDGTVSFQGGSFTIAERPSALGWYWCSNEGTGIWSFEVSGASGTTVTLTPALTPTPPGAAARAQANKNIKNYIPAHAQKDVIRPGEFTLTSAWQRVYASFALDRCTAADRKVSLTVETSGPVEIRRFQYQAVDGGPKVHPDPVPGMYVDGGISTKGMALKCEDPATLRTFPFAQGTCSYWVKNPTGVDTNEMTWTWGLRAEGPNFLFGHHAGAAVMTGERGSIRLTGIPAPRSDEWTHIATVWRQGRLTHYVNGTCVSRKTVNVSGKKRKKKGQEEPSPFDGIRSFIFGTHPDGYGRSMYDEVVVFKRALTDAEIMSLATAQEGLASRGGSLLVGNPVFTAFPRSQKDAALRMETWAKGETSATAALSVDGQPEAPRTVVIPDGKSILTVPFDVTRLRAGEHDYAVTLTAADGRPLASRAGKLTVQPRLEAAPFLFMSWGGSGPISDELLKTVGINCVNVDLAAFKRVKEIAAAGNYVNLRYSNVGAAKACGYDSKSVGEKAAADFAVAAGLDHWRMTLVNTESYGMSAAQEAAKNQDYLDRVAKDIGQMPDFGFSDAPCQIVLKEGEKAPKGEIARTDSPQIATICSVQDKTHPLFDSNRATAEAIHAAKPDVCVWSEPLWGGVASTVDMGADWDYRLGTPETLLDLRSQYANCRRFGKPFMPTLSASYWPQQWGTHPTQKDVEGKPCKVELAESADEVAIKAWMSIAAVPAHNLSFFALNAWQSGPENARKLLADTSGARQEITDEEVEQMLSEDATAALGPVSKPKVTKLPGEEDGSELGLVSEPNPAGRFGAAWRQDLAPAAELLRDLPNVSARVAFLELPESYCGGRFGWATDHYRALRGGIAREAPAFDFIDAEASVETLASYKYLILPMAKVVFKDHAEKLRQAAARGTVIVQDSYATVHYPNEVLMTNAVYKLGKYREMSEMLMPWYRTCLPELEASAGAVSEGDGKTSWTFEKARDGLRYVAVVNDLRVQTNTFINVFRSENYHVVGAPQTVKTTIRNVPEEGEVYLFNAHGRERKMVRKGTTVEVTGAFGPAEGCVYVVVPRPLAAPGLKQDGESLVVSLRNDQGAPVTGRLLVHLTLTDETGAVRDESGRYVVENGSVRIPLFIAEADRAGLASGQWQAQVTDLTTGQPSEKINIVK